MIPYFKYFALITFIIISAIAFFIGDNFKRYAQKSFIQDQKLRISQEISQSFTEKIWCRYEPLFFKLYQEPTIKWQKNKNYNKFSKIAKNILNMQPAFKIEIYKNQENRFFTSNNYELVFFNKMIELETSIDKAKAGLDDAQFIESMGYYNDKGNLSKGSYVRSFIEISTKSCPNSKQKISAVMVFYFDIYDLNNIINYFQIIIISGIIIIFIILYLILIFTSSKAEKIINKQHEEKLRLEKAKALAESQNREKSMFLANVSHELRTPLNAIIGFSEIIKDEVMGPVGHPQYKEYVRDINSSGIHLLSLINDILDYSKAEARKLDVEQVEIDLNKIAISCMRLVETRAKEAAVKLVENIPEKHITLIADPKRMKQVILNLLSNSVKFTPEGGQVTLSIEDRPLEEEVIITVMDNGIGIAAKDISKALAPFGQIDSSISRRYEGTGLGLPLTKKLTNIMGGKFEITSEVNMGTTITLIFKHASKNVR